MKLNLTIETPDGGSPYTVEGDIELTKEERTEFVKALIVAGRSASRAFSPKETVNSSMDIVKHFFGKGTK